MIKETFAARYRNLKQIVTGAADADPDRQMRIEKTRGLYFKSAVGREVLAQELTRLKLFQPLKDMDDLVLLNAGLDLLADLGIDLENVRGIVDAIEKMPTKQEEVKQ